MENAASVTVERQDALETALIRYHGVSNKVDSK